MEHIAIAILLYLLLGCLVHRLLRCFVEAFGALMRLHTVNEYDNIKVTVSRNMIKQ